jgi:hypothetical protein
MLKNLNGGTPMKTLFLALLVVFLPVVAFSTTLNVPSTEYPTIQAGVSAANSGDIVLIASGTYTGSENYNISITIPDITVRGEGDVIIDCAGSYKAFIADAYPGYFIIEGVIILNGRANSYEGVLDSKSGGLTVKDCIFQGSNGCSIYGDTGTPIYIEGIVVEDCAGAVNFGSIHVGNYGTLGMYNSIVRNNSSLGNHAGVFIDNASVTISDCKFYSNQGTTMYSKDGHSVVNVSNSVFHSNTADHTIYVRECALTLTNVTIAYNFGAYGIQVSTTSTLILDHSIIWGHTASPVNVDGSMSATCSDFPSDSPSGNNISEDPMFCDMDGGNFELDAASPCLTGSCGQMGAFGLGCYGAVATEKATWGGIKSMFR